MLRSRQNPQKKNFLHLKDAEFQHVVAKPRQKPPSISSASMPQSPLFFGTLLCPTYRNRAADGFARRSLPEAEKTGAVNQ
jgi:hypothetical protein